jgi:photosynthetic reaction center cytochrome c subunit
VKTVLAATGAVWLLAAVVVAGQAAPRQQMAEQVFKNVQILRGIPVDEFMTTMGFFSASLGLNCTDCHVDESGGSWERYADDNALKQTARRMMLMVQNINRTNFGGRQVVTCTTCHRGSYKPSVRPSLDQLYGPPPPDEPGDLFAQAPGQPAADRVLEKYLAALGGRERVAAVTTIVGKGTYRGFDDAEESALEFYLTAEGQRAIVAHPVAGQSTWLVTPEGGWIAGPPTDRPIPVMAITGQELEGVRVEASVVLPTRLMASLRNWRVGTRALLDDREVQVLQGETPAGAVITLCFDAETGLLRRLVRSSASPVGPLVSRVDYTAYRDVAGMKVPSAWIVSWLSGRSVYKLTDVQANARIDASRFAVPAAPTGRAN